MNSDLSTITTQELVDELFSRADHAVLAAIWKGEQKDKGVATARCQWIGGFYASLGLSLELHHGMVAKLAEQ